MVVRVVPAADRLADLRGAQLSNATVRRHLERASAPVVAFLIDQRWVVDDCGILNSQYGNIREGLLIANRTLNGAAQVKVPVPASMQRERVRERL